MLSPDDLAIVIEYIAASDAMHEMYGSTATCWGGVGGSALTAHCSHICHNHIHDEAQERYRNAYHAIRQLAEREKGELDRITGKSIIREVSKEDIAETVMTEHGMTSLNEFGSRMTMGEMRRMLEHAARLAREAH